MIARQVLYHSSHGPTFTPVSFHLYPHPVPTSCVEINPIYYYVYLKDKAIYLKTSTEHYREEILLTIFLLFIKK
jgi:hypothetical protein